jgi:hypothetical protein
MKAREPQALLIGENAQGSSHLAKLLQERGCKCSFATSYQEACSLLSGERFDLVLSPTRLRDCSIFPLLGLLEGSRVTLFYFQLVEDGCWWLPALRSGRKCFGSYALRPSEFVVSLGEIIDDIQVRSQDTVEAQPASFSASSVSAVPRSWSRARSAQRLNESQPMSYRLARHTA